MTLRGRAVVAASCAALVTLPAAVARAGTATTEQHAGRNVRVFVPTKPAAPAPLVVMLHGCTQTPDAFADATKMDEVAEEAGFVVAYPEEPPSAIASRCWQWWEPAHQARDAGEPKLLATIVDGVVAAHGVDKDQVYAAGISAGGAMTVILGATYPDRFAAVGVLAGLEYKAATTLSAALSASSQGGPSPAAQGALAHAAMGSRARVVPAFVLHGSADSVVAKVNGDQVAAQWLHVAGVVLGEGAIERGSAVPGEDGRPFTRVVHRNKGNGAAIVEHFVVEGLGHAWPGGRDGGSYSDPRGPDASRLLWSFFRGRRVTAPLDVPPAPATPGPGAPAPSPGSEKGGGATSSADAASPANGESSSSCAARPPHGDAAPSSASILALALAAVLGMRRGKRAGRP